MKKVLALTLGICLLSAGSITAQENETPLDVLAQAAREAQTCTYEMEKAALDDQGKPKGAWKKGSGDSGDALQRVLSGDPNYLRALKTLEGSVTIDPQDQNLKRLDFSIPAELPYEKWGFTFFRLRQLRVTLTQTRQGEKWLPSYFELTVRYWRATIFHTTVYDIYRAEILCPAAMSAQ